jgi:hypothetical protein
MREDDDPCRLEDGGTDCGGGSQRDEQILELRMHPNWGRGATAGWAPRV